MVVTRAGGEARDLALRFGAELAQLYGTYEVLDSAVEARLALVNRLAEWEEEEIAARKGPGLATGQERMVLTWRPDQLPVPGLAEMMADVGWQLVTPVDLATPESREAVRFIRFGLTGVEAAFAATGSLLLASAPGQSRAASLLPLRHIALVPFSRLHPTVEAWLSSHRASGDLIEQLRGRSAWHMITGPSKSADIEMSLTLGVHGPKFVHAILFAD
jgi:L-lactate dehydrogenase complex protein LldG